MTTGEVKLLKLPFDDIGFPTWSGDGSVLVQGLNGQTLVRVDVASGGVTTVFESSNQASAIRFAVLSPDGSRLFGLGPHPPRGTSPIVTRELSSGKETTVLSGNPGNFSLSPDGRWLAVVRFGSPSPRIEIIPAIGGDPLPLARGVSDWAIHDRLTPAWSPDGRSIFVLRAERNKPYEVWQIPVDGSEPRDWGIRSDKVFNRISAHPDGRRLVLSQVGGSFETSVLQGTSAGGR